MGCKSVVVLLLTIGAASATVNLTGHWKQNSGWEIVCSWETLPNDTLQSVMMFRNGTQYINYRPVNEENEYPVLDDSSFINKVLHDLDCGSGASSTIQSSKHQEETEGPYIDNNSQNGQGLVVDTDRSLEPIDKHHMRVDCHMTSSNGQKGRCVTFIQYLGPPSVENYACNVSGERPRFRMEHAEFQALVKPSDAEVEVLKQPDATHVNCTASGIPPPNLYWTVNDVKVPADFSGYWWDSNTKLYHSWSSIKSSGSNVKVNCTPTIENSGQTITGMSKTVNAGVSVGAVTSLIVATIASLALLR